MWMGGRSRHPYRAWHIVAWQRCVGEMGQHVCTGKGTADAQYLRDMGICVRGMCVRGMTQQTCVWEMGIADVRMGKAQQIGGGRPSRCVHAGRHSRRVSGGTHRTEVCLRVAQRMCTWGRARRVRMWGMPQQVCIGGGTAAAHCSTTPKACTGSGGYSTSVSCCMLPRSGGMEAIPTYQEVRVVFGCPLCKAGPQGLDGRAQHRAV